MGMFDSFYDSDDNDWQTKAYENVLAQFRQGDELPPLEEHPDLTDYQVEVLGCMPVFELGVPKRRYVDSFTTVIGGKVHEINADRDHQYPRINYDGYRYHPEAEQELEKRTEK